MQVWKTVNSKKNPYLVKKGIWASISLPCGVDVRLVINHSRAKLVYYLVDVHSSVQCIKSPASSIFGARYARNLLFIDCAANLRLQSMRKGVVPRLRSRCFAKPFSVGL